MRQLRIEAFLIICLLLGLLPFAASAGDGAGSNAADFLAMPVGARDLALAGAASALPGDLSAAFHNPALLSTEGGNQIQIGHQQWYQGLRFETLMAATSLPGRLGRVALHCRYLHLDPIPVFDSAMEQVDEASVYDMALGVSYATRLARRLDVGFSVYNVRQHLAGDEASGWAFDLGSGFVASGFYMTAALRNLGGDIEYDDGERYDLDRELSIGVARFFPRTGMTLSAEYSQPRSWGSTLNSGVEYLFADRLVLRAGYSQLLENVGDIPGQLNFGTGIRVSSFSLDYSFRSNEFLGEVHAISIRLLGGGSLSPYKFFRPTLGNN